MELVSIEEIVKFVRNGASIRQNDQQKGIPITRIETISNDRFNFDKLGYADIYDEFQYSEYYLKENDVLISHINSLKYLGRCVKFKGAEEKIIHGMNLLCLRLKDEFNSDYFNYIFKSSKFKDSIMKIAKKSVNQASFTISDLKKIKICIHNKETQEKIVAELDEINNAIEIKKKQLNDLNLFETSFYNEIFSDNIQKYVSLNELADYFIGITYKPSDISENGTIVLRSSNIQNNEIDLSDVVKVNKKINEKYIVRKNDILMCSRNGSANLVGKCAKINDISGHKTFGAFMTIIRPKINTDFLIHFFKTVSFRSQIISGKTTTINQITKSMLDNIKVPYHDIEIQNQFSYIIIKSEKQKEKIQNQIHELSILLRSKMQQYFGN